MPGGVSGGPPQSWWERVYPVWFDNPAEPAPIVRTYRNVCFLKHAWCMYASVILVSEIVIVCGMSLRSRDYQFVDPSFIVPSHRRPVQLGPYNALEAFQIRFAFVPGSGGVLSAEIRLLTSNMRLCSATLYVWACARSKFAREFINPASPILHAGMNVMVWSRCLPTGEGAPTRAGAVRFWVVRRPCLPLAR